MGIGLNVENLDITEYSRLLATKSVIYDHILSDIFLVFQTDSMILPANKQIINEFLNYDYVGAPWLVTNYPLTKNSSFIGNGGFSLRRKSKMLEIVEKIEDEVMKELETDVSKKEKEEKQVVKKIKRPKIVLNKIIQENIETVKIQPENVQTPTQAQVTVVKKRKLVIKNPENTAK